MNNNTQRQPLPDEQTGPSGAITDLIFPAMQWQNEDYTDLLLRIDLYRHFPVLTTFDQGKATSQYVVDPTALAAALSDFPVNTGLLPPNTLFWGHQQSRRIGIYIAPQAHTVSVRNEQRAWRVPLPGLVFIGQDYSYAVWALKDEPTSPNIPVFHAPCPNVHPEGVCRGNAPFPRADTATIWRAAEVFFESRFNQDLSQGKSQEYPDNILERWRALAEAEAEAYPLEDLVPANLTLGRLIDG
jgi:PRTRC genetic system protein B